MDLQELSDRAEIQDALVRYTRAIDTGDWDRLDTVFTPDAHIDYSATGGLVGAYPAVKTWLAEVLPMFGNTQHVIGQSEVTLDGEKLDLSGTRGAVASGVGYVPAERKIEGMVGPMSVADNMMLTKQKARCTGPMVVPKKQAKLVDTWIERLSIRTPHRGTQIGRLSGGNQQKVVLAR